MHAMYNKRLTTAPCSSHRQTVLLVNNSSSLSYVCYDIVVIDACCRDSCSKQRQEKLPQTVLATEKRLLAPSWLQQWHFFSTRDQGTFGCILWPSIGRLRNSSRRLHLWWGREQDFEERDRAAGRQANVQHAAFSFSLEDRAMEEGTLHTAVFGPMACIVG